MGEAKRRKNANPDYGTHKNSLPKETCQSTTQRGLVVSCPIKIVGKMVKIPGNGLDKQELRSALLFWDQVAWPRSRVLNVASGRDESFLEDQGILIRPEAPRGILTGQVSDVLQAEHASIFSSLDEKEPGRWTLAHGENSILIDKAFLQPGKGTLIELVSAIPVPDKEVPLADILDFKRRRRDELERLRSALDSFVTAVSTASDPRAELAKCVDELDVACVDAIRVSRDWHRPIRFTNWKTTYEARPLQILGGGISGLVGAEAIRMNATAALLATFGAAAITGGSWVKITADLGWKGLKRRHGPYRYVADYHNELF